ncbi:MAG TPA: DUF4388 domain-containing protein [Ktedonobacteraceae bacterium]
MSFIGTLEQFSLSTILQKIEGEAKNGVLIIKQEAQWVELSFRQGQLMCIGPIRSNKTLGDRLLQAGVISQKALREVSSTPDASLQNETRTVITLIDLGYLNQDSLYVWAAQEASKVLQVLLRWTTGEIYFEEGLQPPPDRLLIALTVSSLVPLQSFVTNSQAANVNVSSMYLQEQSKFRAASSPIPDALTLHDPSQFYDASAASSISNSMNFSEGYMTDAVRNTDALTSPAAPIGMPKRLTEPLTPKRINTAFMQPQMVLNPTDLSGLRDRNLRVQLTPEQWRLFTVADGKTTLQMACQQLVMSRELVCQVAGELVALSLVTVGLPVSGLTHDSTPFPLDLAHAGFSNSDVAQARGGSDFFSLPPIETHSQWGNGGTGATFVLGNGWVVASSPSQPLQSSELYNASGFEYAEASGIR